MNCSKAVERAYRLLISCLVKPERLIDLTEEDWDQLLPLARSMRLFTRLAALATDAGVAGKLTPRLAPHVAGALRFAANRQRKIRWELHHLEQVLKGLAFPVLVLKGAGYLLADLRVSRGRVFGDVDLLVPRDGIEEVETRLRRSGWVSDSLSAHDERYYREWMHEIPPLRHPGRLVEADIHHSISPLTSRVRVDVSPFFTAALPVEGHPFLVPSAPDLVLHSAVHLFYGGEFEFGLRDLSDLDLMLREFSGHDPQFCVKLVERAEQLQLGRPLFYAFRYVHRVFGFPVPAESLERASRHAPPWPLLRILDATLEPAMMPGPGLVWRTRTWLARWLLWARSHVLKMPLGLLFYHLWRKIGRGGPRAR